MSWNSPRQVIFPKWFDIAIKIVVVLVLSVVGYVHLLVAYGFSPKTTDVGYAPEQPIPYSHALHVGELGIDCRYCHTGVDRNSYSNIPTAQTCMNCHSKVKTDSKLLEPLREAFKEGKPVEWIKVHDLPDYVYFNHSAHVTRGVGCQSCHGRIDQAEVVSQIKPLSMSWCLDCHRHPEAHLRNPAQVKPTFMGFDTLTPSELKKFVNADNRDDYGRQVAKDLGINPPTDCSTCHR
ncbi:MAG: cytochrome c3 family protein [Planctomycetes bacterium]|nr:cytochrome c3 family protein [Planctomycetota bacterium]